MVSDFSERVQRIEEVIDRSPPADRARIERQLNEVLRSVAHLNPLGDRSQALLTDAARGGVYAERNRAEGASARLSATDVRESVQRSLQGSGLSAEQVLSRLEVGAPNAALERQWLGDDLRQIAATGNHDLDRQDGMRAAMSKLDEVHAKLGTALKDAGVLREDGLREGAETRVDHVIAALRDRPTADVLRDPALAEELRTEIEDRLDSEEVNRLKSGDADALVTVAEDRLDRLHLAKTYLQSDTATASSGALDRVISEIADEEVERQRERLAHSDAARGPRHG
jgi:type IV secretion system T-DNA border endonuclease VirD2